MTAPLVLVADNDRAVSSLFVEVLARRGLRTVCAYDGEAAGRLACDPEVRVLVCDLDMPRRSGLEVLESLPPACRPPTVVVSGFLDASVRQRLGDLPFVRAVMKKPFDLFRFADVVQELARAGSTEASTGIEH